MGNLAKYVPGQLEVAGVKLDGSMEKTAELI